jgi:hypothetical protein
MHTFHRSAEEAGEAQTFKPTLSRKLKKQGPTSAKEWGTHFLVKDAKTVKRGHPPILAGLFFGIPK